MNMSLHKQAFREKYEYKKKHIDNVSWVFYTVPIPQVILMYLQGETHGLRPNVIGTKQKSTELSALCNTDHQF